MIERLIEWRNMLRGLQPFPRDFAYYDKIRNKLIRFSIKDFHEFYSNVSKFWKITDCYISIFSEYQRINRVYDIIFFETKDWDDFDIDKIKSNALCIKGILDDNNISYKMVYSGARSIHFYIYLNPPVYLKNYSIARVRLLKKYKLWDYVDQNCNGGPSQLVRIPYTINTKTYMYSVPIVDLENFDVSKAIECSSSFSRVNYNSNEVSDVLVSFDCDASDKIRLDVKSFTSSKVYPPCILELVQSIIETGYLTHYQRFVLANYLISIGESLDSIIYIFSGLRDFDYNKTMYQLSQIVSKDYTCPSCQKIIVNDICPLKDYSKCIFYPNIRKSLKEVLYEY